MKYPILTDDEIDQTLSMETAIDRIETGFKQYVSGNLIAPPRFTVDVENGSLVFTAGGASGEGEGVGFRVYETYPKESSNHTQLVAVFDSSTGEFKGLALGFRLGIIRTGAIGGVAIKYLSRADSKVVGIIGSGTQARAQLVAASVVRDLEYAKVYSPTRKHREKFAKELSRKLDLRIDAVESNELAVSQSDIVICSTRSTTPVFDSEHLQEGMHVTTMAQNLVGRSEIEMEVADRSDTIATDSVAQVDTTGTPTRPYFLASTKHRNRMVELGDIVAGKESGRENDNDITLFCSVGLAGTEVLLANLVFDKIAKT